MARSHRFSALAAGVALACLAKPVTAQAEPPATERIELWGLFQQSFDIFTIAILLGSFVAVAVIVRCTLDIREKKILPQRTLNEIDAMLDAGRPREVSAFVDKEEDFVSVVVRTAMRDAKRGRDAMIDAGEIAASVETSRYLRKIELLSLIGNIAPLIGLAGTVWGMILAFTSLGATEGQAGPAELSIGISKALFHTLLGLSLAIPCLVVAGVYRSIVERLCGRAIAESARLVERLPTEKTP
jgi:biopolymer transport protein ExbB